MKITIEGRRAVAAPPIPTALLLASTRMEGAKKWLKDGGGLSFEPTHWNLEVIREAFPEVEVDDRRETYSRWAEEPAGDALGASPVLPYPKPAAPPYEPRTPPFGVFQTVAVEHCLKHDYAGVFMEQGTGKSWVAMTVAGTRYARGEITGVLVIAFNGVHVQWVEEAFPEHFGAPFRAWAFRKGKSPPEFIYDKDKLAVMTINFEAVATQAGRIAVEAFITMHGGRVLAIVDESQRIKNPDAKSSIEIVELGHYCRYRMILTGTPIAKELTDEWSQFKFLDDSIFGHKYKSTFRAQYCRMHPKLHGVVIGSKNEEKFYAIAAPYVYRVTKSEVLDLPPKVYDRFSFELHPETRKVYDKLKNEFLVQLDSGEVTTVKNALVLLLRLQQVANGFLALDKDDPDEATQFSFLPNARMNALKQVLKSRSGKAVIWCRFRKDVEQCLDEFPDSVSYFGGTSSDDKIEHKRLFCDPDNTEVMKLISNPAVGGTGVDGLQKVARTAIYYSNSFNSLQRWQSEDRTHRIGMSGTCTYIDLVARNTVDVGILANHQKKKQLSDLVLDDIRMLLEGEDE